MKSASSALTTALYTGTSIGIAECWDFYFGSGTVHWTSWNQNVTYGGTTWLAGQAGFGKGKLFSCLGTSIDSLEVTLYGTIAIGGASLIAAACGLAFSGIRAVMRRVYFVAGSAPDCVFDGTVQRVAPETTKLVIEVKSPFSLQDQSRGTRLVQITCPFAVYDSDCGASVLQASAAVGSSSTTTRVYLTSVPSTAAIGSILTFTSGALNGVVGQVKAVGANYVDLDRAVASAPVNGVTCSIKRMCDHTRYTCRAVFNNIARFGGAPCRPASGFQTYDPYQAANAATVIA